MNDKAEQGHPAECTASMAGLGCLMLREAARAVVWGVMLLIIVFVSLGWVKQQAKEAVEYTVQTSLKEAKRAVLAADTFVPLKQNVKEAIEYTVKTAISEGKKAVLAPDTFVPIKQNVKEAIEFTAKTAADEYVRAQRELVSGR